MKTILGSQAVPEQVANPYCSTSAAAIRCLPSQYYLPDFLSTHHLVYPIECCLTKDNNWKRKRSREPAETETEAITREAAAAAGRGSLIICEMTPRAAPSSGGCAMRESWNPPTQACSSGSSFSVSHSISLSLLIPGKKLGENVFLTRNHCKWKETEISLSIRENFLLNFTLNTKTI